jgi:acyl carrier protein phosphodiesterase
MSNVHETEMLHIVRQINSKVHAAPCFFHLYMSVIWDHQLKRLVSSYIPECDKHHQLTHLENQHNTIYTKLSQIYLNLKIPF